MPKFVSFEISDKERIISLRFELERYHSALLEISWKNTGGDYVSIAKLKKYYVDVNKIVTEALKG